MSLLSPSLFGWRWKESWVLDPTLGLEVPKVITMATLGGFVCGTFFVAFIARGFSLTLALFLGCFWYCIICGAAIRSTSLF